MSNRIIKEMQAPGPKESRGKCLPGVCKTQVQDPALRERETESRAYRGKVKLAVESTSRNRCLGRHNPSALQS